MDYLARSSINKTGWKFQPTFYPGQPTFYPIFGGLVIGWYELICFTTLSVWEVIEWMEESHKLRVRGLENEKVNGRGRKWGKEGVLFKTKYLGCELREKIGEYNMGPLTIVKRDVWESHDKIIRLRMFDLTHWVFVWQKSLFWLDGVENREKVKCWWTNKKKRAEEDSTCSIYLMIDTHWHI